MISTDGRTLFAEEFKEKPTVVSSSRFFVRKKSGVWEMYTAEAKPQKVGVEYAHTSGFSDGRALVAERGKAVSIIDTDGKTLKVLDKIDGKTVHGVRPFHEGYAVFMTEDSLYGAIDRGGDCVVKPTFCSLNDCGDGKFLGIDDKYRESVRKDKKDKARLRVIDTRGKTAFEFQASKYADTQSLFFDGLLAVSVKRDGKQCWGIINDKGETVVKPTAKIKSIGNICGKMFTYSNGEGWGLMDTDGKTLIRAKYEQLYLDRDGSLLAAVKNGDEYEWKYIDKEDNAIGDETFVRATPFSMLDGKHAIVKPNDHTYSLIDREGHQLTGLPDIVSVGTYLGEDYVESDYVDIAKLVASFNISVNGVLTLTTKSTPQQAVALSVKCGTAPYNKEHPAGSAWWYDFTDRVYLSHTMGSVESGVALVFTGNLSRQTYRTKRVIDYEFGDYYWYHDNHIPTGYVWNNVQPEGFNISVGNGGRMHGKLRELYHAFAAKFKAMGKVAKENNGAVVIDLGNGKCAEIHMAKDNVAVNWGKLKPIKDIDISEYKDVVEEGEDVMPSLGYLNRLFPDEKAVSGGEQVDTVEVDTVALDY